MKDKPRIFIASSVEGKIVAYTLEDLLQYEADCTVWDQGVFDPASYTMIDLIKMLDFTDYGIFIFTVDDTARIRDCEERIVRDNIILELGLFMGALGREKCFIVMPESKEKVHLPTDLAGMTLLKYDATRKDGNLSAALGPVTLKILNIIKKNPIKKRLSGDIIEQISAIGLSAFYSSRDDYSKYRASASSIDKYINQAQHSICIVSITLSTGISFDDICKVFKKKLKSSRDFEITVSLLNPFIDSLYETLTPQFNQTTKMLQDNTKNTLKTLIDFSATLKEEERERFIIKVHQTLPFGSAIIIDGDYKNGTIQIETKPYGVGMRKSFAFEIHNNNGDFYKTIRSSYENLVYDGIIWSELPLSKVGGKTC